jgi:hypothetical protein
VAPRAAAPGSDADGGTEAPGHQSPPDPAAVYRQVAELALYLHPTATACRIVFDTPAGASTVAVPMTTDDPSELDDRIVDVLTNKQRAGEWMKGKVVAAHLDMEYDGGHLRGALARLARVGTIESSRAGYRMPKG